MYPPDDEVASPDIFGSGPTPLNGTRVLELGQVISAPYAGLLLADLGAEVIKIEAPPEGDSARNPEVTPLEGQSATFLTLNRNKRSLMLDLKLARDYDTFAGLVRTADIVIGNLTPRVARNLRVDADSLTKLNPRIICCSIQGFRSESPRSDEPSFDLVHQALTGYMLMEGRPGDPPLRVSIPIADLSVALFAVYGVLAAVASRAKTGLGDCIEVPMYDSLLSLLTYTATLFLNTGKVPERMGSAHAYTMPWQAVRTKDGYVVVACRSQRFWIRLCEALGADEWIDDARFSTNQARLGHRDDLEQLLETAFGAFTTAEALERLRRAGVPAAPVRTVDRALDELAALDTSVIQQFEDPSLGAVRIVGNPVRFARMNVAAPAPAPALNEYAAEEARRGFELRPMADPEALT